MNPQYNLTTEPWIPVLSSNSNATQDVCLRDALVNAHNYREIAHDSPLVNVSLYTLSLAVLYSIWNDKQWDGDEREDDWQRLWDQKHFDAEAIDAYFAKWHDRFDLFHSEYPFYQVRGLEMNEVSPLVRLAMEENNAPPMFSNRANPDWEAPPPSLAAQLLVAIQSFALGFGKSSKARIEGTEIEPPYSADGPLLRGLTVWPSGENLFETLMLGLVPHELSKADKPCWEQDSPHTLRDTLVAGKRKTIAPLGICDRLTLQSRLIRLIPLEKAGQTIVPGAYFTQGRSLEKDEAGRPSFHPLKLYSESKATGVFPIALSESKAIWRNAHALLDKEARGYDAQNPLAFVARLAGDNTLGDFHPNLEVVGMATEPGKAGKFLLWRHDRMPIAPQLLTDENLVARLKTANEDAGFVADEMRRRFALVARTFIAGDRDGGHKPDPEDVKALVDKFDPRRAFWPRLEEHFHQLLEHIADTPAEALAQWEIDIQKASKECLCAACNALGTSLKAISAIAQIDLNQNFHLAYLRDPQGYLKAQKALKTAAKAKPSTSNSSNFSPSLASDS